MPATAAAEGAPRRPRICFLSAMHPPEDKRVFDKEAVSLAAAGYDVVHLAPGDAAGETVKQGVRLVTYARPRGLRQRVLQLPRLYRAARAVDADAYHCNEVDAWLVGAALKLGRRRPVVFDVHEHYPSNFGDKYAPDWARGVVAAGVRGLFRALAPLTDRYVFAKLSVAGDFPRAEAKGAFVLNYARLGAAGEPGGGPASPESAAAPSAGVPGARNLDAGGDGEPLGAWTAAGEGPSPPPGCDRWVTAIHLGSFARYRGWPQMLAAMAAMREPNLRLHVVGAFTDGSEAEFRAEVRRLGLGDRVLIEGWMPFDRAFERIRRADIGLVLFQPGILNHVYALPHKIFDYMLAGLPVIAPDFAVEVAPTVTREDAGLVVPTDDPGALAAALDRLTSDPELRQAMGDRGRRAVQARYNWEAEAAKLIELYAELIGPPGQAAEPPGLRPSPRP